MTEQIHDDLQSGVITDAVESCAAPIHVKVTPENIITPRKLACATSFPTIIQLFMTKSENALKFMKFMSDDSKITEPYLAVTQLFVAFSKSMNVPLV